LTEGEPSERGSRGDGEGNFPKLGPSAGRERKGRVEVETAKKGKVSKRGAKKKDQGPSGRGRGES
jgi:hypothetical protein